MFLVCREDNEFFCLAVGKSKGWICNQKSFANDYQAFLKEHSHKFASDPDNFMLVYDDESSALMNPDLTDVSFETEIGVTQIHNHESTN